MRGVGLETRSFEAGQRMSGEGKARSLRRVGLVLKGIAALVAVWLLINIILIIVLD